MDYVQGSVAALISGNVTPNRPKLKKKALAPVKHQPSPNVTPKSEFVGDRSIFMSPTQLKKKAILKKSPKRIFESADCEENSDNGNNNMDKVKKRLDDTLQNGSNIETEKSPKKKKKHNNSRDNVQEHVEETPSPKKKKLNEIVEEEVIVCSKKSKKKSKGENISNLETVETEINPIVSESVSTKKKKKHNKNLSKNIEDSENNLGQGAKKNKRKKNKNKEQNIEEAVEDNKETKKQVKFSPNILKSKVTEHESVVEGNSSTKSAKKSKKQNKQAKLNLDTINEGSELEHKTNVDTKKHKKSKKSKTNEDSKLEQEDNIDTKRPKNKKKQAKVNPNAITDKDSESEHESDDDIESNESGDEIVTGDKADDKPSDDKDEDDGVKKDGKVQKTKEKKPKKPFVQEDRDEELSRTLFVGNVPFSKKTKKEIKNIFSKYGPIDSVRIRTIPVKDANTTQRLAAIKQELHPDRTTVNVYIKYQNTSSVEQALVENNTVMGENHLRVGRANQTGAVHDPKMSIFVGNLPFSIEDDALRAKFVKCGDIHSVRVIRDKKTNIGKGFGYVNFESKDGVELALTLKDEDLTIKNRIIRVKRCTNLPPSNNRNLQAQKGERQTSFKGNFQKNFRGGDEQKDGAARRVMNKRKFQEKSSGGPPSKRQRNLDQPSRDKNKRKEFVGLTAEKKKKKKVDKGMKKRKAIAEILSKV